jgi:hypothetical protein
MEVLKDLGIHFKSIISNNSIIDNNKNKNNKNKTIIVYIIVIVKLSI